MGNFYIIALYGEGEYFTVRRNNEKLFHQIGLHKSYWIHNVNFIDGALRWRVYCSPAQLTLLQLSGAILEEIVDGKLY